MNNYSRKFKEWFELRNLREKFFICFFSWAVIYALFSLTLFLPLDRKSNIASETIKIARDKINSWKTQLKFIKEIPNTTLYKEWIVRHQNYLDLKAKYRNLLGDPNDKNWASILKTVLSDYPNITISSVHHTPETTYQTEKVASEPDIIYQQKLNLSVVSEFQDTVGYLLYLEKTLPNIHWDTLIYDVKEYPLANVDMEFSVLYEKPAGS